MKKSFTAILMALAFSSSIFGAELLKTEDSKLKLDGELSPNFYSFIKNEVRGDDDPVLGEGYNRFALDKAELALSYEKGMTLGKITIDFLPLFSSNNSEEDAALSMTDSKYPALSVAKHIYVQHFFTPQIGAKLGAFENVTTEWREKHNKYNFLNYVYMLSEDASPQYLGVKTFQEDLYQRNIGAAFLYKTEQVDVNISIHNNETGIHASHLEGESFGAVDSIYDYSNRKALSVRASYALDAATDLSLFLNYNKFTAGVEGDTDNESAYRFGFAGAYNLDKISAGAKVSYTTSSVKDSSSIYRLYGWFDYDVMESLFLGVSTDFAAIDNDDQTYVHNSLTLAVGTKLTENLKVAGVIESYFNDVDDDDLEQKSLMLGLKTSFTF